MQPGVQRAGRRKEPSESSRTRAGGVQRAGRRALTSAARPAHGRLCAVSSIRRPDAIPYPASESPHRATPYPAFCTARARASVCVCVCVYIHTALFALEHQRQGRTSAAPWTPDGRWRSKRGALETGLPPPDGPSSPRRAFLPQTGPPPPDGPSSPRVALYRRVPPVCMYRQSACMRYM
jgi:hypothetical protein